MARYIQYPIRFCGKNKNPRKSEDFLYFAFLLVSVRRHLVQTYERLPFMSRFVHCKFARFLVQLVGL
jgi:hypothetical protein